MKPDYIFTLAKLINVENDYILVRTSYEGFSDEFISKFPDSSTTDKMREFEMNKCSNIINAFIESKGENPSADVEWLIRGNNLPLDELFYSENGKFEVDILYKKSGKELTFDSKSKTNEGTPVTCYFITENDFGKAKRNWINLFG